MANPEDDPVDALIRHFINVGIEGASDEKSAANPDELEAFEEESQRKKNMYSQYESFENITEDTVDPAAIRDNPRFVLTLSNLDQFNDEDNKQDEKNQCMQLNQSIKNGTQNGMIDSICARLAAVYEVDASQVKLTEVFYGTTNIGYVIYDFTKKKVRQIIKNAKKFIQEMKLTFQQFKDLIITPIPESVDGSYALVKSYHVSCASGKPCNNWNCKLSKHNLGGAVLYMKDGKKDWYCNGRHCKIGYIIVKPVEDIKNCGSGKGVIHGNVYKSVFNEEPLNVVGSGFARQDGVWKWNSGTFNCKGDDYHSDDKKGYDVEFKTMNQIESEWIEKAVKQWFTTGQQNISVTESLVIFKNQ